MNRNMVVLVDEQDNETGSAEKLKAHREALLHRAVSVFVFNSQNQMLIQKRSVGKYHSPGLWTNAACTHPFPCESNENAAKRRLKEEMGIETDLSGIFHFIYKAKLDNELTEYEFDHVFIGYSDKIPVINTEEVEDYKYIAPAQLISHVREFPGEYTVWFKEIFERVINTVEANTGY